MGIGEAKQLLNFHFNASYFKELGKEFLDGDVVSRNIKDIEQSTENLIERQSCARLFNLQKTRKTIQDAYNQNTPAYSVDLDNTSLRGLSYNINPGNYSFNKYILDILNAHWSSTLLQGLIHSTFSKWSEFDAEQKQLLVNFLLEHISNDKSRTAELLKPAAKYLSENGPYKLGYHLRRAGKSISGCCSMFLLPKNRFCYSYFSDVLVGYYDDNLSVNFVELKEVLAFHNTTAVNKRVLPRIIMKFDKKGKVPDELLKLSVELIGDPFLDSYWAPCPGMDRDDVANLEKARLILEEAISAEFINVFFRKLTDDSRRLEFWLKKTKYILDFRVFGSAYSKSRLSGYVDEHLLDRHFFVTASNQNTCAIAMFINNHVIIEFTDVGALYAYHRSTYLYERILENNYDVSKMDDLKLSYLGQLVEIKNDYLYFRIEGKMRHSGDWVYRLESWFSRMVL